MDCAQCLQGFVVGVQRELPAPEVDGEVVNCPCCRCEFEKVRAVVLLVGFEPFCWVDELEIADWVGGVKLYLRPGCVGEDDVDGVVLLDLARCVPNAVVVGLAGDDPGCPWGALEARGCPRVDGEPSDGSWWYACLLYTSPSPRDS